MWRQRWIRWFAAGVIPPAVLSVLRRIEKRGGEGFIVGGCMRDLMLDRSPDDWDVASSLTPEEVRSSFSRTLPTGIEHGTVTVVQGDAHVEVTTFRTEGEYSDHRRPDWVTFSRRLEDDLGRRDFTINAMAMDRRGMLHDPFGGLEDLACGRIRTVGEAAERFNEDALRMVRAVRFAAQLHFAVGEDILLAIRDNARLLRQVSVERIQYELNRILLSSQPARGLRLLQQTELLEQFWPELVEGVGVEQNPHHAYTVWEHTLGTLDAMARLCGSGLVLRLAALLHDVGKPRCLSVDDEGQRRFFNHHVVGAAIARRMLSRLRYDNQTIERTTHLIRHHMALHHYPEMKDAAIRRLINRVGLEHIDDLIQLRIADREGSGTKRGPLSRGTIRLLDRIAKVLEEDSAFSLRDLAVDGNDVMEVAGIDPGPEVGEILEALLDEVLEDPSLNTEPVLRQRIRDMVESGDAEVRE